MLPGLTLTVAPRPAEPDVLRTDVAAFVGRTRRGPVGVPVRVESWNDVLYVAGPPDGTADTPYALRGFFDNGGHTAWLVRVAGASATASALWTVGELRDGGWAPDAPARGGFGYARYRIEATSPGAWANQTRVTIRFRASSPAGPPTVGVRVSAPGEPVESFAGVPPAQVAERLAGSRLVRLVADGPPVPPGATAPTGPLSAEWEIVLGGGTDVPPGRDGYLRAIDAQAELPEPALVALPDLDRPLWTEVVPALLRTIAPLHDRLAVLDLPSGLPFDAASDLVRDLTGSADDTLLAAAAVYYPRLVSGQPGGQPTRTVPASGHVLGLVARLDAERGAHHTPANAVLLDAVDLDPQLTEAQQVRLFEAGVNLLRCTPGHGLKVWGGRTLATGPGTRFVAHRRLVHRLVRAIRRVANPLVFDVNGPELRLTLVRGITSVLLEAFRSGALAGSRPEQAFAVTCDDRNNPPDADPARVVCDVEVAPANPMEFIRLRLVLGQDRGLEVIEA
jgi:phage tail sheath protein FI